MARIVTLLQLRTEVRQRADIENDPHITDTEVNRFINQSAAALHSEIAEVSSDDFIMSSSFTTIKGQEVYQVPPATNFPSESFYKLAHIEAQIQGYWRSLEKWTFEKRTQYRNANTWGLAAQPVAYRLGSADTIIFAPVPDGGYNLNIYYIPAYQDMISDTDLLDGRDGWEEWVVLDAAIKCLVKDESDIAPLSAEREKVMFRIRAQYENKDLDHPDKVRETATSYEGIWPWGVR